MYSNEEKVSCVMKSRENSTIYFFKAIACLCVIAIHAPLPNVCGGGVIIHFARFAVPFFFIITGFFVRFDNSKLKSYIKKLFFLCVKGIIVYGILNIFVKVKSKEFLAWIFALTDYKILFKITILNWVTPLLGVGHLWFVFADLYALGLLYILYEIISKKQADMILYGWSFLSFGLIFSLQIYSEISNTNIESIYWRNFLFFAIPCLTVGHLIRENNNFLLRINQYSVYIFGGIISIFILETVFFEKEYEFYVSSLLIAIYCFAIAVNKPNINILNHMGKNLSGDIYFYHYLFIVLINILTPNNYYIPFLCFVVLGVSLIFCELKYQFYTRK